MFYIMSFFKARISWIFTHSNSTHTVKLNGTIYSSKNIIFIDNIAIFSHSLVVIINHFVNIIIVIIILSSSSMSSKGLSTSPYLTFWQWHISHLLILSSNCHHYSPCNGLTMTGGILYNFSLLFTSGLIVSKICPRYWALLFSPSLTSDRTVIQTSDLSWAPHNYIDIGRLFYDSKQSFIVT